MRHDLGADIANDAEDERRRRLGRAQNLPHFGAVTRAKRSARVLDDARKVAERDAIRVLVKGAFLFGAVAVKNDAEKHTAVLLVVLCVLAGTDRLVLFLATFSGLFRFLM